MKNLFTSLCFLLATTFIINAQTVNITVDVTQNRKPVYPAIYGINNALSDDPSSPLVTADWQRLKDAGIKLFRNNNGNNATKYNWRLKLSSSPDWYNNVYPSDWDFAAKSLQTNIPGAQGLFALQLIGKAASDATHNFDDWGYNHAAWWPGVHQNLAGGGTVDPTNNSPKGLVEGNTSLYLKDWPADSTVKIFDKWFGTAAGSLNLNATTFQYWNMDNEPEIWYSTHDDAMPQQPTAEQFMQMYFKVAKAARAKFPNIKLVGPVPCSEWNWFAWYDNNGFKNSKIAYNGTNYTWIEYFIKRIGEEQKATGIRLLDVVDLHTYLSASSEAELLQVHRVFYDKTFDYPGANGLKLTSPNGWDEGITKEYIFARINDWLTQYLGTGHGVTLGSTESGWDNFNQMPQALSYASILGVFANEGVEVFTPWYWSPSYWEVIHLFSRYSKNISVQSTSSDDNNISAYSTTNSTSDSLTVVLVSRYPTGTKNVKITLSNFNIPDGSYKTLTLDSLPGDNTTQTFVSHTTNALKSRNVAVSGGSMTLNLPPYSITSVILKGASGPYLSVSSASVNVAATANSTGSFNISSNVTWTVTGNPSWLTLSSTGGSNNGTITVTATANTGVARTATVTVAGTGVATKTVTITQAAPSSLTVSPSTLNVNAAASSTGSITITSNIAWAAASNQTWLTVSPATGSNNGTVTLTASANTAATTRSATVTISGTGVTSQTVTVTQAATPTITVSATALNVSVAAGSLATFTVTSNLAWSTLSSQTWLSVNPSSGTAGGPTTVTVTATANTSTTTRSAIVTISGTGATSKTVTITQAGTGLSLLVSPTTMSIAASVSTASFDITSNTTWTVSDDQTWLSVTPASGSNNGVVTISATENKGNLARTSTVTIAGTGVTSKTLAITQAAGTISSVPDISSECIIFPNPLTDNVRIKMQENIFEIQLYTINGNLLVCNKPYVSNVVFDMSAYPSGVYMLKIITREKTLEKKLIKR